MKKRFTTVLYQEVDTFINTLSAPCIHATRKLLSVSERLDVLNPDGLKKLTGTEIWEYRRKCKDGYIRILGFILKAKEGLPTMYCCHAFKKKSAKTPASDIDKAKRLREEALSL